MNSFFKPKSIALVGASNKELSVAYGILNNLIKSNYQGKILAINPNYSEVLGFKSFPNLSATQENIDLVIIAISADKVSSILEEMASLKIKSAIIISSGFKEVGNLRLEQDIVKICRENDIKLIGPNCLGLINPHFNLNASFAGSYPLTGNIAFISQSGAICTGLIDLANSLNIGFSKFISLGNKAVLDEADLIEYLASDEETEIIAIYTEQLQDSKKIISACSKAKKPVIVLKGGFSQVGASASASHTGALVANTGAYQALFNQANFIEVNSIEELLNCLVIFQANLKKKFKDLIVLSNAGGPGVLAVDQAEMKNLNLRILNSPTSLSLLKKMPSNASLNNPVDILGDANIERYSQAFEILQNNEENSAFLVIISPQSMSNILGIVKAIVALKRENTFLSFVLMGSDLLIEAKEFLKKQKISVFTDPKEAVLAISSFYKWQKSIKKINTKNYIVEGCSKSLVERIIKKSLLRESLVIREDLAFKILKAYQIPVLKNYFVRSVSEAQNIAKKFRADVVLKISSPNIIHKTNVGGIKLNVKTREIKESYEKLIQEVGSHKPQAKIEGVLVAEMIKKKGLELIVGAFRDPLLGITLVFGLGGIYVELLKDQSFGLEPISYKQALKMIDSLKINKIFDGYRGAKVYHKAELALSILKIRQLMSDFPEIKEIDINPLMVFAGQKKPIAIDARIILE